MYVGLLEEVIYMNLKVQVSFKGEEGGACGGKSTYY
jgi:hypothetical protein